MIQEFANYLRSIRGYSENTIKAYCADLRSYAQWARENTNQARWRDTTREHLDMYLTYLCDKGLKPTTTNRHLAAIATLFRYFQRQGMVVENPCRYESRRKQPKTEPATIPTQHIAKAYQRTKGLRHNMLGILASTGIRIQEMLDLEWQDIDFQNNTLHIKGKGSKERTVHTEKAVLDDFRKVLEYTKPQGRIFWISQRQARYMIYEALKPYSNSRALNPHAIRHTFATELAKNGTPTATIAKMLGHSHIETSQKYINMAEISTAHKGICLTQNV